MFASIALVEGKNEVFCKLVNYLAFVLVQLEEIDLVRKCRSALRVIEVL